MSSRISPVREELGELISDAIVEFSSEIPRSDYDLWYHDQPIWMIRMVEDHGGRKLIRSVQVTPFDAPDGASLVAIPDAYALTADGAKQPVTAEMRREYRTSLGIDILYRNLAMDKRDEAKGHVVDLIAGAWQGASKLASKLAEEI